MNKKFDFKLIRSSKENTNEFYANTSVEPNSSYEIENCIKNVIKPSELDYQFDFWFDDNDNGYFIKDGLKVEIHYGVMSDFTFSVSNQYNDSELKIIEKWIEMIYSCLLEKEKLKSEQK